MDFDLPYGFLSKPLARQLERCDRALSFETLAHLTSPERFLDAYNNLKK